MNSITTNQPNTRREPISETSCDRKVQKQFWCRNGLNRNILNSFPRDGSNDGFSCLSLLKIPPFIKHTNQNKSRAYTDPTL